MTSKSGKGRHQILESAKSVLLVFSNVQPGRTEEFNDWYDQTHVPEVLAFCEEVVSCQRYRLSHVQLQGEQTHEYLAVYEFEGDSASFLTNLQKANEEFAMSDSLVDAQVIILEPI